jgi:cell wall-associated NlpC family hydrolase
MHRKVLCYILFTILLSCKKPERPTFIIDGTSNNGHNYILLAKPDSDGFVTDISTGSTTPQQLLSFANSLKGIPYKYASTDPMEGFDCSGFIAYVFNHFDIAVPRSSIDFTFVRQPIKLKDAKPGDLILFTGSDSGVRKAGHMGIITQAGGDSIKFIHSSSGKHPGVTETTFKGYYVSRYLKTIRIFPQNNK